MAGFNTGMSPDLVKTELDRLFLSKFNLKVGPNMADVDQSDIFIQDKTKLGAVKTELMADSGMWDERTELEDVDEGQIKNDSSRLFTVVNWAKSLMISKNLFDDENWGAVRKMITAFGNKGRLTGRDNGFKLYRGAFATYKTNDGQYIISDTHTNINGDTIDNKATAALSPASLKVLIAMLAEQKDQKGDIVGHEGKCLLVPNRLYAYAIEVTKSELVADTTDNNVNTFSSEYNLFVKQSNRLSAAAGGSDTAHFLLAPDHTITRFKRQDIQSEWIDYKFDKKNRFEYKGEFREVYGAVSYEGVCASLGTT